MNQAASPLRIDIASPCTASWDKMTGSESVRHCGDCNKSVFNLSAMPEAQAAALMAENTAGQLCVRFYRRGDGTVMTSDCGASTRAATRRALRKLPGLAGSAMLALSVAGCAAGDAVSAEPDGKPATVQADAGPAVMMGEPAFGAVMGAPPPPPRETEPAPLQSKAPETISVTMGKPTAPRLDSAPSILRGQPAVKRKD